jgi:hypothetical protein
MSQALGALGFVVVCALLLARRKPVEQRPSPERRQDVGNLMLALVLAWIYLVFMEFITVWIADIPEEISWYVPHLQTSWYKLGWALVVLGFLFPYVLLLFRRVKRNPLTLGFVAVLIICAYWTDVFWLVMPNLRTAGFDLTWTDLGAFLGVGGLWLAVFIWRLAGKPIHEAEAIGAREAMGHG